MPDAEIDAVRRMLASRPRPASLAERRQRLDGLGGQYPMPADVRVEPADARGVAAEWTATPGADPARVIHGFFRQVERDRLAVGRGGRRRGCLGHASAGEHKARDGEYFDHGSFSRRERDSMGRCPRTGATLERNRTPSKPGLCSGDDPPVMKGTEPDHLVDWKRSGAVAATWGAWQQGRTSTAFRARRSFLPAAERPGTFRHLRSIGMLSAGIGWEQAPEGRDRPSQP